jgi:short-subunit dehydrogenase
VPEALGDRTVAYVCDVTDGAALDRVAQRIIGDLGSVDLLINNAGVSVTAPFEELCEADLRWALEVNFWGVVHGCRTLLPHLRTTPEEHIVNVCSAIACLGLLEKYANDTSKAAVRAFTESLRAELHGSPVGVTLLFPGPLDTNLVRNGRAASEEQRRREVAYLARRGVPPAKVAQACLAGVQRNAPRVVVSAEYRILDLLVRLSPTLAQRLGDRAKRLLPF